MNSAPEITAVVGLGYVGIPLVLEFVRAGFQVIGFDIDADKVATLSQGKSHIDDISNEMLQEALSSKRLKFTTVAKDLSSADLISICVPTPLKKSRDPDTSYIESAVGTVLPHAKKGALIVLESTTYPGTTKELLAGPAEAAGRQIGKDIFIAFSPERVDPGNKKFGVKNTPKVIGGVTSSCAELAKRFYSKAVDQVVTVETTEEAELVKLLENTFRAVNIALVNEFAMLADRMKINIWNVVNAAATKPFGYMPFYPGPGIGGHCIPLDPVYLGWKAKSYDFYSRFIETASDINANMPRIILQKLGRTANEIGMHLKGSRIVVGGIAYKPNVKDARESPAEEVIQLLVDEGLSEVFFVDPLVQNSHEVELPPSVKQLSLEEAVQMKPDVFLLVTPHSSVPWEKIANASKVVFDTRNAMKRNSDHRAWISL
jgi:UDP-N-acetyl-D-glucosamine dehydrogenase